MRSWLALSCLGLWACSERSVVVVPELPAEVAWVGVLFPELGTEPGSGLYSIEPGRAELEVLVPEDASELRLVAFTSDALNLYQPPSEAELGRERLLDIQSGHAAMIPSFSALGTFDDGSSFSPEATSAPVSAEWRPPCADLALSEEKLVHLPCLSNPCAARLTQSACQVVLDAPGCRQRIAGTAERSGGIVFASQTILSHCEAAGPLPITELLCDGPQISTDICPVSLFAFEWEAPRVEARTVELNPGVVERIGMLGLEHLRDLVRHESTLVTLSAGDGEFVDRECAATADLVHIDLETMTISSSRPAPSCPHALALDPPSSTLLVAHGSERTQVTQLDLDGTPVRSVEFPEELQAPEWYPIRAIVEPTDRALVIAFIPPPKLPGEEARPDWRLLVIDTDTLETRGPPLSVPRLTRLMFPGGPREIVLPHGDSTLSVLNTEGPRLGVGLATGALCGPAGTFYGGLYDAARARFLLASRANQNHGVTQVEADGSACRTAFPLESVRSPTSLAWWPADPRLVLTGLDGLDQMIRTEASALAFFDAERRRFLMGEQPIGRGRVKDLQPDGQGGVVMLLPGEAAVARVRPRP